VGVGKLLVGTVAGIRSGDEAVGEAQEMMKSPRNPNSLISLKSLKGREVMEGLYQRGLCHCEPPLLHFGGEAILRLIGDCFAALKRSSQ